MRTIRRFARDESGATLGLALVMILLIGVMGAGLLTFVNRDLGTVIEANRGQRAFEVADAGIGVAKRQLTTDCAPEASGLNCPDHYDDLKWEDGDPEREQIGQEDYQWSWAKGGVDLNDLDGDGNATTVDSVNVIIDFRAFNETFKVISTGTYSTGNGVAKRKIEAIFKGFGGSFGGDGIGHPLYFTPSNITIEAAGEGFTLTGVSLFTKGDIILEGLTTQAAFKADYETSGGFVHIPNPDDELGDWDSTKFKTAPGTWNTQPRTITTKQGNSTKTDPFKEPGFAAEGKICGVPLNSDIGECLDPISGASIPSIADGVYGYDCTTGTVTVEGCTRDTAAGEIPRGNNLTFVDKQPDPVTKKYPNNTPGTITYPFPQLEPKEKRLKDIALETSTPGDPRYHEYDGVNPPPWDDLLDPCCSDRVVFIDAGGHEIEMNAGNANNKGILVVWCGDLQMNSKFQGIILNLYGDGSDPLFNASSCGPDYGVVRNNGQDFSGWLYAEGGTSEKSGIEIGPGSHVGFLPAGNWNFLDDAFAGTPPSAFGFQGWRECYEDQADHPEVCDT